MEFEAQSTATEPQQVTNAEPSPENQSEEEKQLPEELNGLPQEYARETLAEWEKTQAERQAESAPAEETFTLEQYRAKEKEVEELKAKLAEYQKQQPQQRPQPQQPQARQVQPQPQFQSPPLRITQEDSRKIAAAITAEAMSISGLSKEDVASLEYADEDEPRVATWRQAKSLAQNEVYNAIRQARTRQEQQARQFLADHNSAIDIYNTFAQKEFSEPDFKEIQNFATNEFFNELSPNEQRIIANSYLRVKGTSTASDGQLSVREIEKMLEGDFTKLEPRQQKMLYGDRSRTGNESVGEVYMGFWQKRIVPMAGKHMSW